MVVKPLLVKELVAVLALGPPDTQVTLSLMVSLALSLEEVARVVT